MSKAILLPVLALAGGAGGFVLRKWALISALDPATLLFQMDHPAVLGLFALAAVMAAALLVLNLGGRKVDGFAQVYLCPQQGYMAVMAASALLFLACLPLGALECAEALSLWKLDPKHNLMPIMPILTTALCLSAFWGCCPWGAAATAAPSPPTPPCAPPRRPMPPCPG